MSLNKKRKRPTEIYGDSTLRDRWESLSSGENHLTYLEMIWFFKYFQKV